MKVMWLCSTPVGAITDALGLEPAVLGGWMDGAFGDISSIEEIDLLICYPQGRNTAPEKCYPNGACAIGFYWNGVRCSLGDTSALFHNILEDYRPDVIHIFGTEHEYAAILAKVAHDLGMGSRISISIQGLVSICASQFLPDFTRQELRRASLSEIKNRCSLIKQKEDYERRGQWERKLISMATVVMGRTEWDEGCCRLVNPDLTYRHVGETLREEFYVADPGCDISAHRLFFSQGGKPIKAMHRLVEAIPLVAKVFPDVTVAVSGLAELRDGIIRGQSYHRFIARRMHELGVSDRFEFLGALGPKTLIKEMQSSSVFVSTSSIENSPNSMGEAMMLGIPCVSSFVGGVPSIAKDGEEALLFPLNEPEMLARHIIWLFKHEDEALKIGSRGRTRALQNHSREENRRCLLAVYREIEERHSDS